MKVQSSAALLFILTMLLLCACSTSGEEFNVDTDEDADPESADGDEATTDGDLDNETANEESDAIEADEYDINESMETEPDEELIIETDRDNATEGGETPDGDTEDDPGLTGEILPCEPSAGSETVLLLKGTVITPTEAWLNGEVLTDSVSGQILCAAEDCSEHVQYEEASVICAEGVIMPAMLDPHNHSGYNTIPRWKHEGDGHCWQDGTHCQRLNGLYRNRYKWADDPDYDNTLKIHYNSLKDEHHCAMQKWAEIRMMMHGTSGVAGSYNTSLCHCHLDGDLMMVRNLDQPRTCSGLDSDTMRSSISSPCDLDWEDYYAGVCDAFTSGDANVIFLHVAEGVVSDKSQEEFYCLLDPNETDTTKTFMLEEIIGIHSTAAYSDEEQLLACTGLQPDAEDTYKIVWSPRSNIDLYGQTTNIPLALNRGITVALGPDWTPSGSLSQLQEMRCARYVSERYWNKLLDDRTLVRLTTDMAARVMKIDDRLGSLEAGYLADVTVIATDENGRRHPYRTVLGAEAWDVRLLLIGGRPMYGDNGIAPYNALCETLDVCGNEKTICVKKSDNTADAEKGFTQTLSDIREEMTTALQPLKDAAAEEDKYIFELMPLVFCPGTPEYEADQPEEVCTFKHNPHEDVLYPAVPETPVDYDSDEDGIPDDSDNCPYINNADQMNRDQNTIGDACESVEFNPPPSVDCPCMVDVCTRTECLGDKTRFNNKRWSAQACYPGDKPQDYAKLVEISDLWEIGSKFGADDGDIIQIVGAVITARLDGGYYISERSTHRNSAVFIEDDAHGRMIKTGNEVDIVGELKRNSECLSIGLLHVEPADSHRIEAKPEAMPEVELKAGDDPEDFVGMNIKAPAGILPIRWNINTKGLKSGILTESIDGSYRLVPFINEMH